MRLSRRIAATTVAASMLALGAGGIGWAAGSSLNPTDSAGRVTGCFTSAGALRMVNYGTSCGSDSAISWVGRDLSAVVFSTGSLLHGYGVQSVTHPETGVYDVNFVYGEAGGCTQVGSIANNGDGTISIFGGQSAPNSVQVDTFDQSGTPTDLTFQLILSC